jgi:hypothetical protein
LAGRHRSARRGLTIIDQAALGEVRAQLSGLWGSKLSDNRAAITIEAFMKSNRKAHFADEGMQARYRKLLAR